MEKNYSQIYRESILQLVESVVIKSDQSAQALNNLVMLQYGSAAVDKNQRTTWKYYLNVSGQYHPTDTVMTIRSMDTLETIEFSKANLEQHRSTAKAYAFGTNLYKELVNQYPGQKILIHGILYPCDLQTAIDAEDGTILAYPEDLVESWEYSFISRLQKWTYGFMQRWDNTAYNISDELYHAGMLSVLFSSMIGAVYCIRKEAVFTNEVHTYHLRNYLASHGELDKYLAYMTRDQALWLYRNIRYIERHAGHQETFDWLMEHLFTKRNIPLSTFEMRHNLEDIPEDRLRPLVNFHRRELNGLTSSSVRSTYGFSEIFDKEDPLARDNVTYRDLYDGPTATRMEYSRANRLQTKLLESSMINPEGSERFLLDEVRFYQWLYMGNNGRYRAVVPFTSPITGETVYLTAIDAFALYTFLYCALYGTVLTHMPLVTAKRVLKFPEATLADLMPVANKRVPTSFGQRMLDLIPDPVEIISIDLFSEYCYDVWKCANRQWFEVCREEALEVRGSKQVVMNRCWVDQRIQLGTAGQTYAAFFATNNLDIGAYTEGEIQIAHDSLLQSALGVKKTDETSMVGIQRVMTEIMLQLSSYSIQISREINDSAIRDVGQTAIRTDHAKMTPAGYRGIETEVEILHSYTERKAHVLDNMGSANVPMTFETKVWGENTHRIGINVTTFEPAHTNSQLARTGVDVKPILDPLPPEYAHLTNYPGLATFLALTDEQKRALPINIF